MTSESSLHLFVRKLDNHVELPEEDKAAISELPHVIRELPSGAYIVREGEVPGRCAVLLAGFAFRQKLAVDGARQIVSLHIPGDALDIQHLFLDCTDHNVQALTKVSVAVIPRPALQAVAMDRPLIAQAFAISNQVDASIFREWLLNVGRRDAKTRIAHLLCEFAARLEGQDLLAQDGFDFPMTQDQLGDATGLTSVHVNRTLMTLEHEGWIERNRRAIRIPDSRALKQMAGFNALYLHLGRQAAASAGAHTGRSVAA